MNQRITPASRQGFANIALIILVVMLAGGMGYLVLNRKGSIPAPTASPTQTPASAPIPASTPTVIPAPIPSTPSLNKTSSSDKTGKVNKSLPAPSPSKSSLAVLSPNGGEIWARGNRQLITWTPRKQYPVVNIFAELWVCKEPYPCDVGGISGSSANIRFPIADGAPNNGTFEWEVGKTLATNLRMPIGTYVIQVEEKGGYVDKSDNAFNIVASNQGIPSFSQVSITVLSPDGTQSYYQGQTINIQWKTAHLASKQVSIDLYANGSLSQHIATFTQSDADGAGFSVPWTIPSNISEYLGYRVRVSDALNMGVYAESASTFGIAKVSQ